MLKHKYIFCPQKNIKSSCEQKKTCVLSEKKFYLRAKAKLAFTLAEVLITLGIIGVVSAMTLPTLMSTISKKEIESRLKEDFSILAQINRRMIAEEADMNPMVADSNRPALNQWFNDYILQYMNVARVCYEPTTGCWPSSSRTRMLNGSFYTDCKLGYGCGGDIVSFILKNGSMVTVDIGNNEQLRTIFGVDSTAESCVKMYIDVNGDKRPNKFGIDVFLVTMTEDGFVPAGISRTKEQINSDCSPSGNGYWCLTLIKNSGWTIPDKIWKTRNR